MKHGWNIALIFPAKLVAHQLELPNGVAGKSPMEPFGKKGNIWERPKRSELLGKSSIYPMILCRCVATQPRARCVAEEGPPKNSHICRFRFSPFTSIYCLTTKKYASSASELQNCTNFVFCFNPHEFHHVSAGVFPSFKLAMTHRIPRYLVFIPRIVMW